MLPTRQCSPDLCPVALGDRFRRHSETHDFELAPGFTSAGRSRSECTGSPGAVRDQLADRGRANDGTSAAQAAVPPDEEPPQSAFRKRDAGGTRRTCSTSPQSRASSAAAHLAMLTTSASPNQEHSAARSATSSPFHSVALTIGKCTIEGTRGVVGGGHDQPDAGCATAMERNTGVSRKLVDGIGKEDGSPAFLRQLDAAKLRADAKLRCGDTNVSLHHPLHRTDAGWFR